MDSLLWQCLIIVAIAVVIFEARRWSARGLATWRVSLGRARARYRQASRQIRLPVAPRHAPSASLDAAGPAPQVAAPSSAPVQTLQRPEQPKLTGHLRARQASWLALLIVATAAAVLAATMLRSQRGPRERAVLAFPRD
jgi:hypothetical protein